MNRHINLTHLGFGEWFEDQLKLRCGPDDKVARVAAVDRDQLLLIDETGSFRAKLAGSYWHRHHLPQELPCVGDWVCVERHNQDGFGLIQAVLERKTTLRRKAAGSTTEHQMIAANVDYAIIVQSCHFDFNLKRLERYLVMVIDGGAEPYVLLTKLDLVAPDVLAAQLAEIRAAGVSAPVLSLSNVTRQGVEELEAVLQPGKTYCFVGSSGVGKSTIINGLIGRQLLDTQETSSTGEGKHTTVRRELVMLPGGALVIDNPGMREFGILGAENGIESGFGDILTLAAGCRYRDCSHTAEPGCAVLNALATGGLNREHYANFVKLREESEFYQMSHAEKRKKDRDFGRYVKSAKKDIDRD
jgi:ribosome biogenesis GTPase